MEQAMKTNKELMEENAWFIDLIREGGECFLYDNYTIELRSRPIGFEIHGEQFYYRSETRLYSKARPIKTERRYLDAVSQMQWFVDYVYYPDTAGHWLSPYGGPTFYPPMWYWCGRMVSPDNPLKYRPEWIVEVEV